MAIREGNFSRSRFGIFFGDIGQSIAPNRFRRHTADRRSFACGRPIVCLLDIVAASPALKADLARGHGSSFESLRRCGHRRTAAHHEGCAQMYWCKSIRPSPWIEVREIYRAQALAFSRFHLKYCVWSE
jgi:hypothetical protein